MILSQEQAMLNGKIEFERMVQWVQEAGREGRRVDLVEEHLFRSLLGLGKALLQAYLAAQGTGDLGERFEHEGRVLHRLEALHGRRYVSVFGELQVERHVYGTREGQKLEVVPLDARVGLPGLPGGDYSQLLRQWDQSLCVRNSYEEGRGTIEQILASAVSSAERG